MDFSRCVGYGGKGCRKKIPMLREEGKRGTWRGEGVVLSFWGSGGGGGGGKMKIDFECRRNVSGLERGGGGRKGNLLPGKKRIRGNVLKDVERQQLGGSISSRGRGGWGAAW